MRPLLHLIIRYPLLWDSLRRFVEGNTEDEKETLISIIPEHPGPWLDVGCGIGRFTDLFSPTSYLGTEFNDHRLGYVRSHYPHYRFTSMSTEELLAEGLRFSGVLLSHVLHHFPMEECRKLLSQCFGLLEPDGVITVIEWEPLSRDTTWFHNICQRIEDPPNIQAPDVWHAELTRAGFCDIRSRLLANRRHRFHLIKGFRRRHRTGRSWK